MGRDSVRWLKSQKYVNVVRDPCHVLGQKYPELS